MRPPTSIRVIKRFISAKVKRGASDLAYRSGVYHLMGQKYAGAGIIYMLHRVVDDREPLIHPGYAVTTGMVADVLCSVRGMGWDIVTIDEVHRRLVNGDTRRRFVCFTFDDGYLDNLTNALPVFRQYEAPMCVNITVGFLDRSLYYWWGALEAMVLRADKIAIPETSLSLPRIVSTRTTEEKQAAYSVLDGLCHKLGHDFFPTLNDLFRQHHIDVTDVLDSDALSTAQARTLAADPLVTIGAHGITHRSMSKLTDNEAWHEIFAARPVLENAVGIEVRHLAFPFGGPNACSTREFSYAARAGFDTAVTTRRGNVFPEHAGFRHCLPRRTIPMGPMSFRNTLFGVETFMKRQNRFQTN